MISNFAELVKRIKEEGGPEVSALPHSTVVAVLDAAFAVITTEVREAGEADTRIPRLGVFKSKMVTAKEGPQAGKSHLRTVYVPPKAAAESDAEADADATAE